MFAIDWWESAGRVRWEARSREIFEELERCQQMAEQYREPYRCSLGDGQILVYERGMGTGRASRLEFRLEWCGVTMGLSPRREPDRKLSNFYLKVTGEACVMIGAERVRETLFGWLEEWGGSLFDEWCRRLDVCLDLPGLAWQDALLPACADAEWRVIIALARFAGLRTPSETMALRWEDIDWAGNRMLVRSPKTEHHAGKEFRIVPLFPEIRESLADAFEAAQPGAAFVVEKYRRGCQNLRTHMLRMIRRAGLEPWTRPFHNLRASCETDLANRFPTHVVSKWLGNSVRVAAAHDLQVTDEHFERAVGEKALQKALQQASETGRKQRKSENEKRRNPLEFQRLPILAAQCHERQYTSLGSNQQPSVP